MGISAIMTCYNQDIQLVDRAITSVLYTAKNPDFQLLLLDNHSPNMKVSTLLRKYSDPRVEVMDFGKNVGKGRGFNAVWQAGKLNPYNFITVISDDIEVLTREWDMQFMHIFESDNRMGSLSAFIESGPGMPNPKILREETIGNEQILISSGSIGGDLTMYRPGVIEAAGLFTSTLYGHEDHDMALKLRNMGYLNGYVKEIKMNHYGHEDPLWAEWKREMHDGKTGLQYPDWLKMREGSYWQKFRDVAMTRFHISLEGGRGSKR